MNINNNNSNNNNNNKKDEKDENDSKCNIHQNEIISFCENCNNMPLCLKCMCNDEGENNETINHKGHSFLSICYKKIESIFNDFKNKHLNTLSSLMDLDDFLMQQLDDCMDLLTERHDLTIKKINNQFRQLHNLLSIVELDLIKQCNSFLESNRIKCLKNKSELENDKIIINNLLKKYNNNKNNNNSNNNNNNNDKKNNNNNNNDNSDNNNSDNYCNEENNKNDKENLNLISILKDNQISNEIISRRKYSNFNLFNDFDISFNKESIDLFNSSIKSITTIDIKPFEDRKNLKHLMINKQLKLNDIIFKIDNNETIIQNDYSKLSIGNNCNLELIKIPNNIKKLIICDGYKYEIGEGVIPKSIEKLYIGDIDKPLTNFSIPDNVKFLNIKCGYKFSLDQGIIPNSIHSLYIGEIKEPLSRQSIPDSVRWLYFLNDFNHPITSNMIPTRNSVCKTLLESVHIHKIKYPLTDKSLPNDIKGLCFKDGFDQEITSEIIPKSVERLHIFEIKSTISSVKLPLNSIKFLYLYDGFNQNISSAIIPSSVHTLYIANIKSIIGQLPNNIKHFYIDGGPDQQLIPGLITDNVVSLFLYSLKYPLLIGSIPSSVTYLRLGNGFNQPLISGIIPSSVQKLGMYDIKYPPKPGSIPNSVTELYLCGRFSHSIDENVIPRSISFLHLYNIIKPIPSYSIPFVKWLYCYDDFSHKLDISFLPNSIEKLILYNIKQPIGVGSLSHCINISEIQLKGYNHPITQPNILPNTLKKLFIYNLKKEITTNSLPSSLKELHLCDGFNPNLLDLDSIPSFIEIK
ncbi:hypothetical protein ACTFIW_002310 [Dictyostelium discoideum]